MGWSLFFAIIWLSVMNCVGATPGNQHVDDGVSMNPSTGTPYNQFVRIKGTGPLRDMETALNNGYRYFDLWVQAQFPIIPTDKAAIQAAKKEVIPGSISQDIYTKLSYKLIKNDSAGELELFRISKIPQRTSSLPLVRRASYAPRDSINYILDVVRKFLQARPSEIVVLRFHHKKITHPEYSYFGLGTMEFNDQSTDYYYNLLEKLKFKDITYRNGGSSLSTWPTFGALRAQRKQIIFLTNEPDDIKRTRPDPLFLYQDF